MISASARLLEWISGPASAFRFGLRVFNIYCVASGVVLIIAAFFNHIAGLHPVNTITAALFGPLYFVFFYLSRFRGLGRYLVWPFWLSGLGLIALLWFYSGGISGSTPLVCVLGLVISLLIFDDRKPLVIAIVFSAFVLALAAVEEFRPDLVLAYPTRDAQLSDLKFGLVVTLILTAILISSLRKTYEKEQEKVAAQNRLLLEQKTSLIASRADADRALKARSDFLSVVSHELRTPLNSVIGLTELLRSETPREDQKEYLDILSFSAANLLALVNDVLDYTRLEAGQIDTESIAFDLHGLLERVAASFLRRAQEKGIELTLIVDKDVPVTVKGDMNRLVQILNNLLGNAVKFTAEGSVVLRAGVSDKGIMFEVRDTGIGIPPDRLDQIFDKFTQAGPHIARQFGGTGLGLAITRSIAEILGGSIHVESTYKQGSRFICTLPLPAVSGPGGARSAPAAIKPGLRVLLAEDYEPNVLLARKFLERWSLEVETASHGLEALALCREKSFDVLILDIQMPEMDGLETARAVRAMGGTWAHVPIIALTAGALPEERARALEAGFNEYMSKPFSSDQLRDTIARCTSG